MIGTLIKGLNSKNYLTAKDNFSGLRTLREEPITKRYHGYISSSDIYRTPLIIKYFRFCMNTEMT